MFNLCSTFMHFLYFILHLLPLLLYPNRHVDNVKRYVDMRTLINWIPILLALSLLVGFCLAQNATTTTTTTSSSSSSTGQDATPTGEPKEKKGGKPDITQMDLLSGIPAVALFVAGIIQAFHSPAHLCRYQLKIYLDWLKARIEEDFSITLYSCTKSCHTCVYEPSYEAIEKRILSNSGLAQSVGCIEMNHVTVDDLLTIIKADGNAYTLMDLAELSGYPQMRKLSRVIRTVAYSPRRGRGIVFFQWFIVGFRFLLYWIFAGTVPKTTVRVCSALRSFVRRLFWKLPPAGLGLNERIGFDYRISELARHRIQHLHLPWVRYGIYHMLMELADKKLSVRSWGVDEEIAASKEKNTSQNTDSSDQNQGQNENSPLFSNIVLEERRLITNMTTDECSAARLLYTISLHSIRALLMCRAVGYVPPHILLGSFKVVSCKPVSTIVIISHPRMDALYEFMYRNTTTRQDMEMPDSQSYRSDYVHSCYNIMLKTMQSRMGAMVTSKCQAYILTNIALYPISLISLEKYVPELLQTTVQSTPNFSISPTSLNVPVSFNSHNLSNTSMTSAHSASLDRATYDISIDGVRLREEEAKKLCASHLETAVRIMTNLEKLQSANLFWGPSIWLLLIFSTVYHDVHDFEQRKAKESLPSGNSADIKAILKMLLHLPFQILIPNYENFDPNSSSKINIRSLDAIKRVMINWNVFENADFCCSAPAWCLCKNHCRGICTLAVNELELNIVVKNYFQAPYVFSMKTFSKRVDQNTQRAENSNSASQNQTEAQAQDELLEQTEQDQLPEQTEQDGSQNQEADPNAPFNPPPFIYKEKYQRTFNKSTDETPTNNIETLVRLVCLREWSVFKDLKNRDVHTVEEFVDNYLPKLRQTEPASTAEKTTSTDADTNASANSDTDANTNSSNSIMHHGPFKTKPGHRLNRVDSTKEQLGELLHMDMAYILAMYANQLYIIQPPNHDSTSKWPFKDKMEPITKDLLQVVTITIPKTPVLQLEVPDRLDHQLSKEVCLSTGQLKHIRRRRRNIKREFGKPFKSTEIITEN